MTWDSDRYFSKASLYWSRATAHERASDEFLLNLAFACEFLTRAGLCHLNPALNAASDTESLLHASGIAARRPPRTADMTEGLDRLQRGVCPELTDLEITTVKLLVDARNLELHGDESSLAQSITQDALRAIYCFMVKACRGMKQEPSDLMGPEDGAMAVQVHDAAIKDRKQRVQGLVRAHKDRFFSLSEEEQRAAREAGKVEFESAVLKSGNHVRREKCPACANSALLAGPPVGRSAPFLRDGEILQEVRAVPTLLSCKCCELSIRGLDELMAAGFPHEFTSIDQLDPIEHFSIDPMDYIDIDEIIREYQQSDYEYQDE